MVLLYSSWITSSTRARWFFDKANMGFSLICFYFLLKVINNRPSSNFGIKLITLSGEFITRLSLPVHNITKFLFFFWSWKILLKVWTSKIICFSYSSLYCVYRCQMVICLRRTMMKSILSFWVTSEAKIGGFRPIFMAMEVPTLAEKRDTISGSTPQKITINTAFSGLILRSCKHKSSIPHTPFLVSLSLFHTILDLYNFFRYLLWQTKAFYELVFTFIH